MLHALPMVLLLMGAPTDPVVDMLQVLENQQRVLFEKLAPSVVFISKKNSFGSGFFVSSQGLIMTNAHVVGKSKTVDVVLHGGEKFSGKVVELADKNLDLALVQIKKSNTPALTIKNLHGIRVGDWAGAVGHGEGAIWTYNTGMVSNIYGAKTNKAVIQTQIPLNAGNSGGPIVNRRGEVFAIVTAGIAQANAINFGIPMETAVARLPRLSKHCPCLVIHAPKGVPIFVNNLMIGAGPQAAFLAQPGQYEIFAVINGKKVTAKVQYPARRKVVLK